jgi:hypothetical protein
MSGWLIAITGLMYAAVAVDQAVKGSGPMSMVYAGYAFSNIGLWMAVK